MPATHPLGRRTKGRAGRDGRWEAGIDLPVIVRRIVVGFDPERIILFGSHSRGTATPDSDVDLLIVMRPELVRDDTVEAIRRALDGLPETVDVFVATPDDVEAERDIIGSLIEPALREGRVVWERSPGLPSNGGRDMPSWRERVDGVVRDWVAKAELDMEALKQLLPAGDRLNDMVCFHAAQAVEKYLKAALVSAQIRFAQTHNVTKLVDRLPAGLDVSLDAQMQKRLTAYATDTRYPGRWATPRPPATRAETEAAVSAARAVRASVRGLLPLTALD